MPSKSTLNKLNNKQVDKLKGKLLEVRRIGSKPIFITVATRTTIEDALLNANIDVSSNEVKVEAQIDENRGWEEVALTAKAIKYSKIAVTTKVSGA